MDSTPAPGQLTVGGLLEALDHLDQDLPVHMAGMGIANAPFALGRHRLHTDGLAIHAFHSQNPWTVGRLASALRRRVEGRPTDRYTPTLDTPVWVQPVNVLEFKAITSVAKTKRHAVIRNTNLAPAFGPSLQRLTDDEARARLRETGGGPCADAAERYLLRIAPGERSQALQRIREAREQIAVLQAGITQYQDTVARTEYILGITDVRP